MKNILMLALLIVGGILLYNYSQQGEWTLSFKKLTPEEQQLKALENQLQEIEKEIRGLDRQSRATGLIVPQVAMSDQDNLMQKRAELTEQIAALRARIADGARKQSSE